MNLSRFPRSLPLRRSTLALLGALLGALLLALTTTLAISGLTTGAADAATGNHTLFAQSFNGRLGAYQPRRLLVSGDGSLLVTQMRWSSWTAQSATGQGVMKLNDCKPDCADGTFHSYPVKVTLTRTRPACHREFFSRLVLQFPSGHPSMYHQTERIGLFPLVC